MSKQTLEGILHLSQEHLFEVTSSFINLGQYF